MIANLNSSNNMSGAWSLLLVPITFYAVGIIFWFIPYTLLAVGMWFWSRNKSVAYLRKLGLSAPIVFSGLISIEYSIIMLANNSSTIDWDATTGFLALLVFSSMVYGYLFVGIAILVFNALQSKNLIVEEVSSLEAEFI
ncbi:MAG TPA: hypothetical protein VLA72_17435 [Anaerolineales bacterium]|nr:hypothetical protein [Anaerolineales bacterium]